MAIFLIIVNIFVIYADKAEKPWAYIPYLALYGIFIGFLISIIVFFLIIWIPLLLVVVQTGLQNKLNNQADDLGYFLQIKTLDGGMTIVIRSNIINSNHFSVVVYGFIAAVVLSISTSYTCYHWNIVYRARQYMINELVPRGMRKELSNSQDCVSDCSF